MHPSDVKAEMEKKRITQRQIADELGVCQQAVSLVLHGRTSSMRIARRIAKAVGKSPAEIWPGKYR